MGLCCCGCSSPTQFEEIKDDNNDDPVDNEITNYMQIKENEYLRDQHHILLMGMASCGKTTILKQFNYLYDCGVWDNKENIECNENNMDINYKPTFTDFIGYKSKINENGGIVKLMDRDSDCSFIDIENNRKNRNKQHFPPFNVKKRGYLFQDIRCIAFIFSLDDCFTPDLMKHSVDYFQSIYASKWFLRKTEVLLLFNKIDKFQFNLRKGINIKYNNNPIKFNNLPHYTLNDKIPLIFSHFIRNIDINIPTNIIHLIQEFMVLINKNHSFETDDDYFQHCLNESLQFVYNEFISTAGVEWRRKPVHKYTICAICHPKEMKPFFQDIFEKYIFISSWGWNGLV